jgi:tetratricopeptide (TPR) repeat protein
MTGTTIARLAVLALVSAPLAPAQYRARLALEDGTPFSTMPMVVPSTHYDAPECIIRNLFGNGQIVYYVNWRSPGYSRETPDLCRAAFTVPGYQRADVILRDGAVILMKRLGDHEGYSVSMTVLKAPPEARKAYGKGVAAIAKRKWAEAQKELQRAIGIYPDYAPAWSDLGLAFMEQSQPKEAVSAWERAIEADPKYAKPYLQLARLAVNEGRMEDAVQIANRALSARAAAPPGIYFYQAVANFNLHRLDAAEKGARQTIGLDANHEYTQAEHLLGEVLAAKGDRAGAVEHLKRYLELAPKAQDVPAVKQRIAELERAGG